MQTSKGVTRQVRGDIAEAKRARKALREGREKLVSWDQAKRELGLSERAFLLANDRH